MTKIRNGKPASCVFLIIAAREQLSLLGNCEYVSLVSLSIITKISASKPYFRNSVIYFLYRSGSIPL